MKFVNIGFGNTVCAERVVAVASPESAPIKRLVTESRADGRIVDVSCGRKTRSVIVTDSHHIILSALQCETVAARLNGSDESIDEAAADVDDNGKVNNRDLGRLQQYLNGYDITLGPEQPEGDDNIYNDTELDWS